LTVSLKAIFKYSILFLIGIVVLYLAFKEQDLKKIWIEIKTANFLWVAASVVAVWLAHLLRALRWQMLYSSIQFRVGFWNTYHAVMIGYLANLALPRFGEIGRCSVVRRMEGVPMFASIGTVITERLFDIAVLLLTACIMVVFQYHVVSGFLYDTIYSSLLNKIHGINYYWIAVFSVLAFLLLALAVYFFRHKFSVKLLRIVVALRQGFGSYNKVQNKPLFLSFTFGIWLLYLLSMYFAFFAIQTTAHLNIEVAFTALVFSGFAMAAPVQGGIGVFHWMVAQSLMLYSVHFKDGLAYATIIHSSQLLLILFLGSLSLLIILTKNKHLRA